MIIRSSGLFGLDHHTMVYLIIAIALALVPASNSAPMYESDQTELENYGESTGCYYNYNHYGEGDRIMTNEPCLNCTCHDRMLMCYLRVCPFTKAIGQDCTIEKREDQCCPVITCPEVEVQLLDHQTTANPSNALGATASSEVGAPDQYGCSINGRFYPEGAQVPSNPQKPCELCYCIRNMTTCVMQECTLHIDGCQPIYNKGVCCPVKYDCDHDKDSTPMLEDESTTTVRPTPGFILTTTVTPSVSTDCVHNGETYADGALIMTEKPCEHCYCMRGDIVCAVQECGTPLENEGKNCTALPPAAGQCCPDKYVCDGSAATMLTTTTVPSIPTSADDASSQEQEQEQEEDQQQFDDNKATKSEQEAVATTQASLESSTTMATMVQKDVVSADDDDVDDDQQEQEHVAPQFEDVQTDDSHEEDDTDEQVADKVDDEQRITTAQPSVGEEHDIASDHIPGHEVAHEKEEHQPQETTTVESDFEAAALTTLRPDAASHVTEPVQDETSTETHDDVEVSSDTSDATTVAPTKEKQEEPEADQVSAEEDEDEATSTPKPTVDVIASSSEPTTVRNVEDITESAMTTSLPALANADEKENEINEHHDEATETNVVKHPAEHDDDVSSDEHDEQKEHDDQEKQEDNEESSTTTARPEQDELSGEPEIHAHVPASEAVKPEQDAPEVSTEKKEASQKADDQLEQDFVELPPAVVVTELPPIPTTSDELLTSEQTPEPPKDEILPNLPLEADSHVLSDSMTTEHAPTFGDRKEDDAQEPEQMHVAAGADMEEPVEMNTIIPLEQDEQKVEQPLNEENEVAYDKEQEHEVEHDQHTEEDDDSAEEQDRVTSAQDEVQTQATPVDEKLADEDDKQMVSPDKLFPESIPGEGDCLIDGVTYENGASVPPSGKCQVACHCSNSIVHCEMVRCMAAPSEDCTPKSTLSGECCPTYVCPKETTSTASSVSVESTEASTESDAESDEEQLSADVSAESSEASTKAPVSDSQFTSTDEEDDESSQPSEAESDSAGFDVDDDVFKPLRPQEPSLDMNIDYFAGNRPTTANYDDEIILSTAAPTKPPALVDVVSESVTKQSTPIDTTPSAYETSTSVQKEESTTLGDAAERGPEAEQDELEVTREQDEEMRSTTTKTFAVESETTAVPIKEKVESSSVQNEVVQVEVTTTGAVMDSEQSVTTSAADEVEDDGQQQQEVTSDVVSADDEQESVKPEQDSTTSRPAIGGEIERDDEQERPVQTTIRSVEPTVEDATEQKPTEQSINDIESDDSSSTVEGDDKPAAVADEEDIPAQEATTTRATDIGTERVTMAETIDSTSVPSVSTEQEEDRVQQATTQPPAAALDNELESVEKASEEQKDEIEDVEPTAPSTAKSVTELEQTTPYLKESNAEQKQTTVADEEQTFTTASAPVTEKDPEVPASVSVQTAMEEDREDERKTTEAAVTQKPIVPSTEDDSIIFRDDDEEDAPIVKPTLDENIPPQGTVKPTVVDIKPTQDVVKPQVADREETDDDNLISPEQDGGFHFPQEEDDESEEPVYKPSLDDTEQHVAMPLPVEIPQETVPLEPVDQIKEQEQDLGQSTTVQSDEVTITPSTVGPLKPEQDRDQITHDDTQESNEIEADVEQVATPIKKPEDTPVYDDIEETEQQTVAPAKHTPELTTVGQKQDTESQSTTEKYYVSTDAHDKTDDEQEQPTTTTHPGEAFDAKPAIEQEQDEKEDDEEKQSDLENIHPTTARAVAVDSAQDEKQDVTTVSPIVAHDEVEQDKLDEQEQDKQTTPSAPAHDDEHSEEEDEHTQIHLDDNEEDVPAATTPRVTQDLESQNEDETEKEQVSDDQGESDDDDATTKATAAYDEVQTTTVTVDVKQTHSSVVTEQSTTLAPVQDVVKEDEKTEKPDFTAVESDAADASSEDDDEQKETVTKVPVAQAADDASEEVESVTKDDDDDSSSITEATQKDSEEDEKVDDDQQDELSRTTLAPQTTQDKKQQSESEPDVTVKPDASEPVAPVEDDVDFEQEQQTIASPTTPQAAEEKDKEMTTSLPLDEDKLPESLSTEADKLDVSTEQEVQVTTIRATEFDFNAVDKHQEHPLPEPAFDDDVQDEIAHSTTFATPELSSVAYEPADKKPAEPESDESVSTDETSNAPFDESGKPDADSNEEDVPSVVSVTTGASVDDDDSQEEEDEDDGQLTTVRPKPIREEESPMSTTVAVARDPEHDETSEGPIDAQEPEQTSESVVASVPESDDKVQAPVASTDKPAVPVEAATTSEEEQDDVEQPQTDDLNADDDSSEEEDTPVTLTTLATPVKATTPSDVTSASPKDTTTEEVTPKAEVYTTLAPVADSQVTEQQTTLRQEDEPVSTAAPVPYSNATAVTQQAEDVSQTTSATVVKQDEEKEHTIAPDVSQDEVTELTSTSPVTTTSHPTDSKAEEPVREVSIPVTVQDELSQSTVAPVVVQDDKLDEKVDKKPVAPAQDEEVSQKPQPAGDDSDEQQAAVKPTFTEEEEDDQQKVQEPDFTGLHEDSSASAKPTQQPETVGPSYGAPGQHYDTGYGHMPPHYPPSSYEDDYGEEEDPAAFGPGTCRYGGKLYVSAQQIPRDDPCDFCFCFRSDIICLQQSCPPPISGCNEEPIAGFCCPRYECPVSMATVLNVTTSTTTTTTTLPPHFLSHAYKGHVQKRGCQIQGKPYNVGETVASASGPCMRCTCGGDGQMQCEPKACSPEPMLQQMIAVAAARRR